MKTNLKILTIVIVFVTLISVACGATPTPAPTPTEVPTQTPLPTYTPQPTYTPFPTPTQVPPTPTDIPTDIPVEKPQSSGLLPVPSGSDLDVEKFECPNSDYPTGVSTADCYKLNNKALGVVYFDSKGKAIGIGVTWDENDDMAYSAGEFIGLAAYSYDWNIDDTMGSINKITNAETWYTQGTVSAKISKSDGFITIVVKLKGSGIGSGA